MTESLDEGEVMTAAGDGGDVTAIAVPGPAATASQSGATTRPASPTDAPSTRGFDQVGTAASLLAALVVAVLAGVVVLARR